MRVTLFLGELFNPPTMPVRLATWVGLVSSVLTLGAVAWLFVWDYPSGGQLTVWITLYVSIFVSTASLLATRLLVRGYKKRLSDRKLVDQQDLIQDVLL